MEEQNEREKWENKEFGGKEKRKKEIRQWIVF